MSFGWLSDFSYCMRLLLAQFTRQHRVHSPLVSLENYPVGVWRCIADVCSAWEAPWEQLCQGLHRNLWVATTRFYCAGLVTGVTALIAWFSLRNARLEAQSF